MDLEGRVLKDFYPVFFEGDLRLKQGHGVKSLGFRNVGNAFDFSIQSPSVKEFHERKYLLNYHKNGANSSEKIIPENFSGLIGESIMRIVVKEFFRRISNEYYLKDMRFIKSNLNPFEDKRVIVENDDYLLEGLSRYNQRVFCKTDMDAGCTTEYDGLFEYDAGFTKGLVICESKVGALGYLKASDKNKKKIYRRIVRPIQSLFPDRQVDYLLMGSRDEILQKKKMKPLKKGLASLYFYLKEHNIGLIPFLLPESRKKIDQVATSILYLNKLGDLDEGKIPPDNKYLVSGDVIRIIKGKRIDMILKKSGDYNYTVIYDSGN